MHSVGLEQTQVRKCAFFIVFYTSQPPASIISRILFGKEKLFGSNLRALSVRGRQSARATLPACSFLQSQKWRFLDVSRTEIPDEAESTHVQGNWVHLSTGLPQLSGWVLSKKQPFLDIKNISTTKTRISKYRRFPII